MAKVDIQNLESCIGSNVKISLSTSRGNIELEGEVKRVTFPWNLEIFTSNYNDGVFKGNCFAGAFRGILKVTNKNGEVVYQNNQIPVPYPEYNLFNKKSLNALNKLREQCFGKDSEYKCY